MKKHGMRYRDPPIPYHGYPNGLYQITEAIRQSVVDTWADANRFKWETKKTTNSDEAAKRNGNWAAAAAAAAPQ